MLKFVQRSVLRTLMLNGRREGLKASPLLLLGYKGTLGPLFMCSATLCEPPDESNVSSEQIGSDSAREAKNSGEGSHARLWSALAYFDTLLASVFTGR